MNPGRYRFNLNRAHVVDENFIAHARAMTEAPGLSEPTPPLAGALRPRAADDVIDPSSGLTGRDLVELFESQIVARHVDLEARNMRSRNEGFYTIASAGHEGNAVVGRLTRHTDLGFLHYRSGAFMAERARQVPDIDFIKDAMLGFAASRDDPAAGGRHKVWGSKRLFVPPQTSTIASHLPKAVGAAMALPRVVRLGLDFQVPADAIVVCSFGDASVNHASAQTALNAAENAAHRHLPVPILFVCEDNGIGISVSTPRDWIETAMSRRRGLHYLQCDGLDLIDAWRATWNAVEMCRRLRMPVFLHLRVVRLLGHAGSDAETEYRRWERIEATEAKDPLLASADLVTRLGLFTPNQVLELYQQVRLRAKQAARYAATTKKLERAAEVVAPLAPYSPDKVEAEAARTVRKDERIAVFGGEERLPENGPPRHMAVLLNQGLHDLMIKYPQLLLFGEDVAKKGGVYHVTTGLSAKFGLGRVFDTLLDETMVLGLAVGAAHVGFLPVPEIQYLAYYHNAQDQIRGEACSLQFFSNDQFRNPMVMRIAGWAYQKGFGGHFHNDNGIAALRDVPGLVVATPCRGDDAVKMLRTCLAMAKVDGRVVAFIEPIALYMTKDLHEPKDRAWSFHYPPPNETIPFGEGAVYRSEPLRPSSAGCDHGEDLTILTFANGVHMSLRAAEVLQRKHGVAVRVVDLRWLCPLNEDFIAEQASATRNVLVVDEGRRTGGVGEAIMATLYERCGRDVRARRISGLDTYIPLGPAADLVLPQVAEIVAAALDTASHCGCKPQRKRPTRTAPRG